MLVISKEIIKKQTGERKAEDEVEREPVVGTFQLVVHQPTYILNFNFDFPILIYAGER